jgi:hypothetical protein
MGAAIALLLAILTSHTLAQSSGDQNSQNSGDQNSLGAAPAAVGSDTTTQLSENPPISGLDRPSFEPGFGARSYLLPKAWVSESVDSNVGGSFSSSNWTETTRALGGIELQKLWKVHPLDVDYLGGVDWYSRTGGNLYQVHSLEATQRFLWRTGQFAIRDSFSYLPEGGFGFTSFGGVGSVFGENPAGTGFAGGGLGGILTNTQFGSLATEPRINNMSTVDITQYLSPRSAVVVAGSFGLTDFLDNTAGYLNSQEVIAQASYDYQFSKNNQVAVFYAFEQVHFPLSAAGSLGLDLVQLSYGHRITGKLDLIIGGGPEWVHRHQLVETLLGIVPLGPCVNPTALTPCGTEKSTFVTGSAQGLLRYRMSSRTDLLLQYLRYVNAGSGFFGGATSDVVRFTFDHHLTRRLNMSIDSGWSRNSRVLLATAPIANGTRTYDYWFIGGGVHRQLGRQFSIFANYQYDRTAFGSSGCSATATSCGQRAGRNIGLVGLRWIPHPIRLD